MINHTSDSASSGPGGVPVACADVGADLLAFFRDELLPDERASVISHLDGGCTECRAALEGMRALEVLMSSFELPTAEPSPELSARLSASIRTPVGDPGHREAPAPRHTPLSTRRSGDAG